MVNHLTPTYRSSLEMTLEIFLTLARGNSESWRPEVCEPSMKSPLASGQNLWPVSRGQPPGLLHRTSLQLSAQLNMRFPPREPTYNSLPCFPIWSSSSELPEKVLGQVGFPILLVLKTRVPRALLCSGALLCLPAWIATSTNPGLCSRSELFQDQAPPLSASGGAVGFWTVCSGWSLS